MATGTSGILKPSRKELYAVLSTEKKLGEFELELHGVRENTKKASARNKLEKPLVDMLGCILRALRVCLTSERASLFPRVLG
jgi:hypothetical protein